MGCRGFPQVVCVTLSQRQGTGCLEDIDRFELFCLISFCFYAPYSIFFYFEGREYQQYKEGTSKIYGKNSQLQVSSGVQGFP